MFVNFCQPIFEKSNHYIAVIINNLINDEKQSKNENVFTFEHIYRHQNFVLIFQTIFKVLTLILI